MSLPNKQLYEFENFQLNPEKRQLTREGKRVIINPKAFDLLVLLVKNHERPVTKDEMREQVWHDQLISDDRIFAQAKKIRKILGKRGHGRNKEEYIETLPGEGYQFIAPVNKITIVEEEQLVTVELSSKWSTRKTILLGVLVTLALSVALFFYRRWEMEMIRRVVRESQEYEALVAYTDPDAFNERTLSKYWLDEPQGGRDIKRVKNSLGKLRDEGRRYGKESKLVSFDVLDVNWLLFTNTAEVKTKESWFLPMYYRDGKPYPRIPEQGWDGFYVLRKVNGAWLIQSATLPPPKPVPTPSVAPTQ